MKEEVRNWLIKAFEDYTVAKHEMNLSEDEMVPSMICLHSQQFVEKLMKAYLILKGIDFPRTHNLEFLRELCAKQDRDFEKLDFGDLSKYAVEIRYPEEFYTPSIQEAKEYFNIAKTVKDFLLKKIGIEEEEVLEWIRKEIRN